MLLTEFLRTRILELAVHRLGILKYMAFVEDFWFSRFLHGREYAPPWDAVDWKADPDWEWPRCPTYAGGPPGLVGFHVSSALWQTTSSMMPWGSRK
jgi:hypothetical protein